MRTVGGVAVGDCVLDESVKAGRIRKRRYQKGQIPGFAFFVVK